MLIRFFNDWGLAGERVLLIGIAKPGVDRGEASEAVRKAMPEDREAYPEAWAAYEAAQAALTVGPRSTERPDETGTGGDHAGNQ